MRRRGGRLVGRARGLRQRRWRRPRARPVPLLKHNLVIGIVTENYGSFAQRALQLFIRVVVVVARLFFGNSHKFVEIRILVLLCKYEENYEV